MRFSLAPREERFFDMFEKSADTVLEGVRLFKDMMDHFENVEEKARQLKEVENRGDTNTHEIVEKLNRSFVTPLDRDDIHALSSELDDILDCVEALASRFLMFHIQEVTPEMKTFAQLILQATEEISKAVHSLKKLDNLMSFCKEIKRLENMGDDLSRKVIADLFADEKDPIRLIILKEIYGRLETAMDKCEDVANIIEAIVVKNA
jgi:uncharacterized protein